MTGSSSWCPGSIRTQLAVGPCLHLVMVMIQTGGSVGCSRPLTSIIDCDFNGETRDGDLARGQDPILCRCVAADFFAKAPHTPRGVTESRGQDLDEKFLAAQGDIAADGMPYCGLHPTSRWRGQIRGSSYRCSLWEVAARLRSQHFVGPGCRATGYWALVCSQAPLSIWVSPGLSVTQECERQRWSGTL